MARNFNSSNSKTLKIKEEIKITDPSLALIVFHEKKKMILKMLLEKAMTIQDLKKATNLNPGTIKRHLDDLVKNELVFVAQVKYSDYNIRMKYYRATAKNFIINIKISGN